MTWYRTDGQFNITMGVLNLSLGIGMIKVPPLLYQSQSLAVVPKLYFGTVLGDKRFLSLFVQRKWSITDEQDKFV